MVQAPDKQKVVKFELPGSKTHYPPSYSFTIVHASLKIEPNLQEGSIAAEAVLKIKALEDIDILELDAVELEVEAVTRKEGEKLPHYMHANRLQIKLGTNLSAGKETTISISYEAKPHKGFYFIRKDQYYAKNTEAWTQGQTNEARHWFPIIDHPQVKFPVDIEVIAPSGYNVISNGIRKEGVIARADNKIVHRWSHDRPIPAYLVSIVIGDYDSNAEDKLSFYVPKYVTPEDRKRSFARTSDMMKFFEEYFDFPYPYEKYSQVTVQDFHFQGMENASCTTLTLDTIHDERAHIDYPSENLVSHELAHQWFGDLVTCRDWQHLWLNEGFATYCEALYQEYWKGKDDFYQLMIENADTYFEEASSRYVRPIVTNVYKHPDDLFDTHSYAKAACVINMLRQLLGEAHFKASVRTYLKKFADQAADTFDLIKVFESQSGKSLQQFFEQWIFRPGHPELEISYSADGGMGKLRIKQVQSGDPFDFNLDVRLVFGKNDEKIFSFAITERESTLLIPAEGKNLAWLSVDPEFKILASMVLIDFPWELLANQLRQGCTIVERVQAARALKSYTSHLVVKCLKESVLSDRFWAVSVESAKSLGTIKEDYAYDALKDCLIQVKDLRIKRAIVAALGEFRNKELVNMLNPILQSNTESYRVQCDAATAIGKTKQALAAEILRKAVDNPTYLDLLAQGAIAGLKEFAGDKSIAEFLLQKTTYGNRPKIREVSTLALGKFASGNQTIIDHLRYSLLRDKWFRVRNNACKALAEAEITDTISDIQWVAEHDVDAGVRRIADECLIILKEIAEISKRRTTRTIGETRPAAEEEVEEQARRKRKTRLLEFLSNSDIQQKQDR